MNIHKYKEKRAAKYNNFNSINPSEMQKDQIGKEEAEPSKKDV